MTERRRRVVALLTVCAALVAGCGSGDDDGIEEPPDNARLTPKPVDQIPPRGQFFGFSGGYFQWTGRHPDLDMGLNADRTWNDAARVGANSARFDVAWSEVEPNRGHIDYDYVARIDDMVKELEQRRARPILVLGSTPPWAAQTDAPGSPPRADMVDAFAKHAAWVARRWPGVLAIETWNEPNGKNAWSTGADPELYTQLHKAVAVRIREVAPKIQVLVGGLIMQPGDTGETMRPQLFLKRMYAAGLNTLDYDGLALHPYPDQRGGTIAPYATGWVARSFFDFRAGYKHEDPRAPLYVTETGITTTGPDAVSPDVQAAELPKLVKFLLGLPRVRGVWVHTQYHLESAPDTSPERGFGVLEARGEQTPGALPAYCALRSVARTRAPAPEACGPAAP